MKYISDIVGVLPHGLPRIAQHVNGKYDDCINNMAYDVTSMSAFTLHFLMRTASNRHIKLAVSSELLWRSDAFQWRSVHPYDCNITTDNGDVEYDNHADVCSCNEHHTCDDDFLPFGEEYDGMKIPKHLKRKQHHAHKARMKNTYHNDVRV